MQPYYEKMSSSSGVFNIHGFGRFLPSFTSADCFLMRLRRGSFQLSNKYEGRPAAEDDDPANNGGRSHSTRHSLTWETINGRVIILGGWPALIFVA